MFESPVLIYASRENTPEHEIGGWGKLETINDLWMMIGYYANKSGTRLEVHYLEYFNPEYLSNIEYQKQWFKKIQESNNPIAILKIDGQLRYFYLNKAYKF